MIWRSSFASRFENPFALGPSTAVPAASPRFESGQSRTVASLACAVFVAIALSAASPPSGRAQDWGYESDDGGSIPARSQPVATLSGWSLRSGIGFTAGPDALLLEFELPYAFDQWVSAGPMLQLGIDDENTVVAPSANITITIPDLPGNDFDRVHPYAYVGLGFAVIGDDDRQNDNTAVGFLIPVGFGIEYQISDRLSLGSQMTLNFLPKETLDQGFWFSWQVGGIRIAF